MRNITKAGLAVVAGAASVIASMGVAYAGGTPKPTGESTAKCLFFGGTTVCGQSGPASYTTGQTPADPITGCYYVTHTYADYYTAHRGTYNSSGNPVTAKPLTLVSDSATCPTGTAVPLFASDVSQSSCADRTAGIGTTQIGTLYYTVVGSDVNVQGFVGGATPSASYYFAERCIAYVDTTITTDANGATTFQETLSGAAGQTMNFDFYTNSQSPGDVLGITPMVTLV